MEVGTHIELWHVLTVAGTVLAFFLGITAALGKLLVHQFKEHVDEKFKAMEEVRKASTEHWDEQFSKLDDTTRKLEKDFLHFKAELPLQYVRRDDYLRGQTVIELKIDAVMNELKMVQIKGARDD
jgi:hypothetical protein